jgi:hypothetical protein
MLQRRKNLRPNRLIRDIKEAKHELLVLVICHGGWDRCPLANRSPSPRAGPRHSPGNSVPEAGNR